MSHKIKFITRDREKIYENMQQKSTAKNELFMWMTETSTTIKQEKKNSWHILVASREICWAHNKCMYECVWMCVSMCCVYAIHIICLSSMYGLYETHIQRYARVCDRGRKKQSLKRSMRSHGRGRRRRRRHCLTLKMSDSVCVV